MALTQAKATGSSYQLAVSGRVFLSLTLRTSQQTPEKEKWLAYSGLHFPGLPLPQPRGQDLPGLLSGQGGTCPPGRAWWWW